MPSHQGALEKSDGLFIGPKSLVSFYREKYGKNSLFGVEILGLGRFDDIKRQHIDNYNILLENIKKGDIFLGGDHSVTYCIFKAIKKKYRDCGLLVFDCHVDMHVLFDFVVHQDWIYYLVEEGVVSGEDIMIFGVRDLSSLEERFAKANKVNIIKYDSNIYKKIDKVLDFCKKYKYVYVSFDIDVISPKFAPGTGYIKKGGITALFAYKILFEIKSKVNVICFDLVEINPKLDKNNKTLGVASRIINLMIK